MYNHVITHYDAQVISNFDPEAGSRVLLPCLHQFLYISLLTDLRYSGLTLDFPCPSLRISHLSGGPWTFSHIKSY